MTTGEMMFLFVAIGAAVSFGGVLGYYDRQQWKDH